MIKLQSDLHSRTTPHSSPLRASYGVSFMSYRKKIDRDISRAHCAMAAGGLATQAWGGSQGIISHGVELAFLWFSNFNIINIMVDCKIIMMKHTVTRDQLLTWCDSWKRKNKLETFVMELRYLIMKAWKRWKALCRRQTRMQFVEWKSL